MGRLISSIRLSDIFLSITGIVLLSPLIFLVLSMCALQYGNPIFRQLRVGKDGKYFYLFKFRTMPISTPSVLTHSLDLSELPMVSKFLRRSKLDEIPQLYNVLRGEMSLVGPRPGLISDVELIERRKQLGVLRILPGCTGIAQIKGVSMQQPEQIVLLDSQLKESLDIRFYFKILILTFKTLFRHPENFF